MNVGDCGQVAVAQGFSLLCPKTERTCNPLIFRCFARQQGFFGTFWVKIRYIVLSSGISVNNRAGGRALSTPRKHFFDEASQ
jgi:hypothetical protein